MALQAPWLQAAVALRAPWLQAAWQQQQQQQVLQQRPAWPGQMGCPLMGRQPLPLQVSLLLLLLACSLRPRHCYQPS